MGLPQAPKCESFTNLPKNQNSTTQMYCLEVYVLHVSEPWEWHFNFSHSPLDKLNQLLRALLDINLWPCPKTGLYKNKDSIS